MSQLVEGSDLRKGLWPGRGFLEPGVGRGSGAVSEGLSAERVSGIGCKTWIQTRGYFRDGSSRKKLGGG